jgi:TPR repeat protein
MLFLNFCFKNNKHKAILLSVALYVMSPFAIADEAADMVHHAGLLAKLGNYKGAEQWYKKAVNKGAVEANYLLAVMTIRGYVRTPDIKQAINYYTLAAEQNHVKAQYELSVIYSNKNLEYINHEKHLYWLKKAAANNHEIALHNLATIAVRVKKFATAINLFSKAKDLDYAPSILSLGNMYYYGLGVKKSHAIAFNLLDDAFTKGENSAALQLGMLYERGIGTTKNSKKAKELYRVAIDEGNSNAGFNLALLMIETGEKKDGLKVMGNMASLGDKRAKEYLSRN